MGERPHYTIIIDSLPEEDGGGFVATVPDLPGCMSDGATESEAVQNVQDAISCWIEAAEEEHRPIPVPSHLRRAAAG
ncbi:type II toxin-antitoxin system HicB family antitoxin [Bradyrhizobium diazoefficiens]|uniref:type II toxin-antitoxin system HicB family antitoxin n=1 Tax=Bradyrhizobium diazoefficiens TaxID=1355477 RepID=UPI00190B8448|nr:type II toxin-antitoxin system HicB family antitoxin [Bradyrhizobium diazoefficiens]MBK3663283.1 type II toxin-antitoxin system HicB family antitoxin [Bradyrhizobium diazoefficiens]